MSWLAEMNLVNLEKVETFTTKHTLLMFKNTGFPW